MSIICFNTELYSEFILYLKTLFWERNLMIKKKIRGQKGFIFAVLQLWAAFLKESLGKGEISSTTQEVTSVESLIANIKYWFICSELNLY